MKTKLAVAALTLGLAFSVLKSPEYELSERGQWVAYRGGGQLLDYATFNHQCVANQIVKSPNTHIENTLQSMDAAVKAGFSAIHLNIHHTVDGKFAVFHDWTLDCATNGSGVTKKRDMKYLKSLDAGYGYTFDGGKTFPWRGKGYRVASLDEVVERYPHVELWLNMKTGDRKSVVALLAYKKSLPAHQRSRFFHFAANKNLSLYTPNGVKRSALSMESGKKCILDYILYGWSRFYPESCSNTKVVVPPSFTKYLWGWPEQFAARAQKHGSRVYLWMKHSEFSPEYDFLDRGVGVIIGDIAGVNSRD
ncbi:glycerophosphodiester phosphodiesterase family protein [Microbulbifer sp.]|uniref:glycerophosphodiester phosphodiesterase family protein n=1 Tax=Microbulbifer sp. TaxID=1908541 RepID=UPI003F390736